jgi:hypothetical protein
MLQIGQNADTYQTTVTTPGRSVCLTGFTILDRDSAFCQRIARFEASTLTCRSSQASPYCLPPTSSPLETEVGLGPDSEE